MVYFMNRPREGGQGHFIPNRDDAGPTDLVTVWSVTIGKAERNKSLVCIFVLWIVDHHYCDGLGGFKALKMERG